MPQVYSDESKVNAKQNLPVKMVKKAEGQEKEIWKPIKGYENIYEVSSLGRVRGVNRLKLSTGRYYSPQKKKKFHLWKGRILKLSESTGYGRCGYLFVGLNKNGISKIYKIHKLVANAFIGECPKGKTINHKDFVRGNNRVSNLEYLTPKENSQHALIGGRYKSFKGEDSAVSKLKNSDVFLIRKLYPEKNCNQLAKKFNVDRKTIYNIVARKNWKHLE